MATSNVFLTLDAPDFRARDVSIPEKCGSCGFEYPGRFCPDPACGKDKLPLADPKKYGTDVWYREGAIEVLDYGFKIWQEGSEEAGRPRSVEVVKRNRLSIVKAADSRTPLLFSYCCKGSYISEAELHIFDRDPSQPFLSYILSYVHVASFTPAGGTKISTETIELAYGQMEVKYDNQGLGTVLQGNPKTGSLSRKWSWVMEMPKIAVH